ncbi:MAG TPA: fibronectin type III domain-containing protein, partial [Promineifilum sp.]
VTININKRSLRVPVSLSITAPPAAPPPPPPQSTSATLTWSPNAETDLAGYKVYVGKASGIYGAPIIIGKQTSYTVSNLQLGNTYYFALSAYDINGNESALSAVTSKSIY